MNRRKAEGRITVLNTWFSPLTVAFIAQINDKSSSAKVFFNSGFRLLYSYVRSHSLDINVNAS